MPKLVSIAYDGYATAGSTIMVQGFYSDPDWHWTPPAGQAYAYDPAKATEMLAAAGYKTSGGKLLDKQGKPISLRLFACEAPPQGQKIGKLLTGWFEAIGIDIKFSYMTEGALNEYLYNEKDGVFTPNMDLFVYNWTGDVDPDFILSLFTKAQIGDWSDCAWWTPEYDKLYTQQSQTIDPAQRKALIDRMQQIAYEQSPYSVLAYPKGLEAVNTSAGRAGCSHRRRRARRSTPSTTSTATCTCTRRRGRRGRSTTGGSSTTLYVVVA